MGHRKRHAPKHGSLAYLPRGRARSLIGRTRFWPEFKGETRLLGFAGYKVGMTHTFAVEDNPRSPQQGKEVFLPVTVLDTPPLIVCGVRAYTQTTEGIRCLSEVWAKNLPKDLGRAFTPPENTEGSLEGLERDVNRVSELRVIVCTQPRLTYLPKKKPELFEIKVGGGNVQAQLDYVKEILGKAVKPSEVFREGEYVDVSAVSKGKGVQGVVKRWGVHLLPHKSRKKVRGIGTLGPWTPSRVMYTVPRSGQTGLFQRIQYNKRVIRIGEKGDEVTPKGGFLNYGVLRGGYMLLEGSVPGPAKRLIKLRQPARPPSMESTTSPRITFVKV